MVESRSTLPVFGVDFSFFVVLTLLENLNYFGVRNSNLSVSRQQIYSALVRDVCSYYRSCLQTHVSNWPIVTD